MRKIVIILLITLLSYLNLIPSLRLKLIENLKPFIVFNRNVEIGFKESIGLLFAINEMREENHKLKSQNFIFVSKEYKEKIEKIDSSELKSLQQSIHDDSFYEGKSYGFSEVYRIDSHNFKILIRKTPGFGDGDIVMYGRTYLGNIINSGEEFFEVKMWNTKENNLNALLLNKVDEKIKVIIKTENFNTSYVDNILSTENVSIGDLLVTSPVNDHVPAGLILGQVDRVEGVTAQPFRKAYIKREFDLEKVGQVVLLKYKKWNIY